MNVTVLPPTAPQPTPMETLLKRYDRQVPRYTSYPTAPLFQAGFPASTVENWLHTIPENESISVYLHMVYCKMLCWYCGCNMKVTNNTEPKVRYVEKLMEEIRRTTGLIGRKQKVGTLHFGGGTPTYFPAESMETLLGLLHETFDIQKNAEISIEIDPRQMNEAMADVLARGGITRASLGVQDTNPTVQKAVNRVQPLAQTKAAVDMLRARGINAINFDLVYGLPFQTPATIRQTVEDVCAMNPSRLAIYGYAHVPWMKKHQAVLERFPLPGAEERATLLQTATECFKTHGYVPLGMDHFAKPEDPLVKAEKEGRMNRNFMGYTADEAETLLGFGATAISSFHQGFCQNISDVKAYETTVSEGKNPVAKGLAKTARDMMVAEVIRNLLCRFQADTAAIAQKHGFAEDCFAEACEKLAPLEADHLVTLSANGKTISITPTGRTFSRVVASCFDDYLNPTQTRHARAV